VNRDDKLNINGLKEGGNIWELKWALLRGENVREGSNWERHITLQVLSEKKKTSRGYNSASFGGGGAKVLGNIPLKKRRGQYRRRFRKADSVENR